LVAFLQSVSTVYVIGAYLHQSVTSYIPGTLLGSSHVASEAYTYEYGR